MVLNRFSGWLDYPEYYFFWNFHGNNSIFNISAYKNPKMDELIDLARFTDDDAEYEKSREGVRRAVHADVPIVPLNQPIHDVAMQKAVGGYEFWFHREPDFRQFVEGVGQVPSVRRPNRSSAARPVAGRRVDSDIKRGLRQARGSARLRS